MGRPPDLLTVIVVNYFTKTLTKNAVADFVGKVPVIIVDNSQDRYESEWLEQNIPDARTVVAKQNLGFGAGVNLGLSAVRTPYALVVNPDAFIGFAAAMRMLEHCIKNDVDIASPAILDGPNGNVWYAGGSVNRRMVSATHERIGQPHTEAGISATEFVSGCITLFGPKVVGQREPYDPTLFMYWEDVDLSLRARSVGWKIAVDHSVEAVHEEGGSTTAGRVGRSALFHYYQARNRVIVGTRHFGIRSVLLGTPEYNARVVKSVIQNDSDKLRNVWAFLTGTVRGIVSVMAGDYIRPLSPEPRVLRIWNDFRSFHCELVGAIGGTVIFQKRSYDFDDALLENVDARELGTLATAGLILTSRSTTIELNEPLTVGLWPKLLTYALAIRVARALGRGPETVTTYAIENADVAGSLQSFLGRKRLGFLPAGPPAHHLGLFIMQSVDKIAFGTHGAFDTYNDLNLLGDNRHLRFRVIEQLPSPCRCSKEQSVRRTERKFDLCFVGSFEARKGVLETLQLFSDLERLSESPLRFKIVGKGPEEEAVRSWCAHRDNVSLQVDPPRSAIHEALRQSVALILLSQRKDSWREQVGLPILEALAHGCRVVSTAETGLADWLRNNGHLVLPSPATSGVVESLLAFLAADDPSEDEVLASLPKRHGRIVAASWLDGVRNE